MTKITMESLIKLSLRRENLFGRVVQGNNQALEGLEKAIYKLNDTSVLNTAVIKALNATIEKALKRGFFVFVVVILALIVLAGAEKVLDYIKILPF